MKCTSYWVVAAIAAMAGAGAARAESEAEYAAPPAPVSAKPATARPAARPSMFAPAAAANARRLSVQQREEWRFLKEAAAASRLEAEASRLALARSSDPDVRSLAATLINHNAVVGNDLLHMLHGRGMAAPMMSNDQRKTLNRLAKLQGRKFDREYLEQVALRFQQDDVHLYERASQVASEPRLKAWIDKTLPTVRYHLATAERLAPPDVRMAKVKPTVNASQVQPVRQAAAREAPAAAHPVVSRASVSTQSMGAGPSPLGTAPQLGTQHSGNQPMFAP
jgi:putative membrane protein